MNCNGHKDKYSCPGYKQSVPLPLYVELETFNRVMYYIQVILPLAVEDEYYYALPHSLIGDSVSEEIVGRRVVVSLGERRSYTGVISTVSEIPPAGRIAGRIKRVDALMDETPIVSAEQIVLWRWIASYYHCRLGQVMRVAIPGGLLPGSGTMIHLADDYRAEHRMTVMEEAILDQLTREPKRVLSIEALRSRLGRISMSVLTKLIGLGAIYTEERIRERYTPLKIEYVVLNKAYAETMALSELMDGLSKAPRQLSCMLDYLSHHASEDYTTRVAVARRDLTRGDTQRASALRKLIERGVFDVEIREVSRMSTVLVPSSDRKIPIIDTEPLTEQTTLLYIEDRNERELHIVSHVARVINQGHQVLLLSPSVYDMPSSEKYLMALHQAAGGAVYHFHSGVSEAKRTELYLRLRQETRPYLVLGTRAAVFLPMRSLGLVVVDQEQEYMYKHQHVAPLYHARNVALYLADRMQIKILLASSSPSAETMFNALRGKYALRQRLRYDLEQTDKIRIIDLGQYRKLRGWCSEVIMPPLFDAITQTMAEKRRILLLQNRRGYAPYLVCQGCGAQIKCPHCSVSLINYAQRRQLRCRYCDFVSQVPHACPSCGLHEVIGSGSEMAEPALRSVGYGVERMEEEVQRLFPNAKVLRIDSDGLQSARQREECRIRIARGDVNIIVGTQLIKGQPIWDNVGLIGVLQFDHLIGYPDFRSEERAYQLLHQLRQRAMDSLSSPDLWLQTYNPEHPFIETFRSQSYASIIRGVLSERHLLGLPPLVRMTHIHIRGGEECLVEQIGQALSHLLRGLLGEERVSGVLTPVVARVDMQYIRLIVCRRPYQMSYVSEREAFRKASEQLKVLYPLVSRVRITYDIDPL